VIESFTVSPSPVAPLDATALSWQVVGASHLDLEPGIGDVTGQSTYPLTPSATMQFTLIASNDAGSTQAQVTVGVLPAIHDFRATPDAVDAGDSVVLSWSVEGAQSLSINNGVGPVAGAQVTLTPPYTARYVLTAANDAGSISAQTDVTVRPLLSVGPTDFHLHDGDPGSFQPLTVTLLGGQDGGVSWRCHIGNLGGGLSCVSMAGVPYVDAADVARCTARTLLDGGAITDAGPISVEYQLTATSNDDAHVTAEINVSCDWP
jgi:hypothetical protein